MASSAYVSLRTHILVAGGERSGKRTLLSTIARISPDTTSFLEHPFEKSFLKIVLSPSHTDQFNKQIDLYKEWQSQGEPERRFVRGEDYDTTGGYSYDLITKIEDGQKRAIDALMDTNMMKICGCLFSKDSEGAPTSIVSSWFWAGDSVMDVKQRVGSLFTLTFPLAVFVFDTRGKIPAFEAVVNRIQAARREAGARYSAIVLIANVRDKDLLPEIREVALPFAKDQSVIYCELDVTNTKQVSNWMFFMQRLCLIVRKKRLSSERTTPNGLFRYDSLDQEEEYEHFAMLYNRNVVERFVLESESEGPNRPSTTGKILTRKETRELLHEGEYGCFVRCVGKVEEDEGEEVLRPPPPLPPRPNAVVLTKYVVTFRPAYKRVDGVSVTSNIQPGPEDGTGECILM